MGAGAEPPGSTHFNHWKCLKHYLLTDNGGGFVVFRLDALAKALSVIARVAVDMKYHIHIHIHRCLSCVNVYPVNNYKSTVAFYCLLAVFITKQKMKKHTQVRSKSVLSYRVQFRKKSQNSHGFISPLSPHPALQRHIRQLHPLQFPSSTPPH